MSASLDEVRHVKETAVYTHWCSLNKLPRGSASSDLLKNLGIGELTEETIKSSETFVCRIYNVHRTDSINAARHLLFSNTMKPEAVAPTSDALSFHLMIWRNAHCSTPELPAPSGMGWRLVESRLRPVLMALSPIPDSCLEVVVCLCLNNARLVAANARNQDCNAHQCVYASIKLMIRWLAWIHIRENWLWWLKAVYAVGLVPILSKSHTFLIWQPFCLC